MTSPAAHVLHPSWAFASTPGPACRPCQTVSSLLAHFAVALQLSGHVAVQRQHLWQWMAASRSLPWVSLQQSACPLQADACSGAIAVVAAAAGMHAVATATSARLVLAFPPSHSSSCDLLDAKPESAPLFALACRVPLAVVQATSYFRIQQSSAAISTARECSVGGCPWPVQLTRACRVVGPC